MDLSTMPYSQKPTGWFQVGWSAEIPPGGVKSMKYFGHDLVAFRTEQGKLSIMNAHCLHMGAHLGHGTRVEGDSIVCRYHGWRWNGEGQNTLIPYQDNTINKKLKTWHVREQHQCIFMWHDPAGGPPRWEPAHIFDSYPELASRLPKSESDYYDVYPSSCRKHNYEPVHPTVAFENAIDSMHFRYTHSAPVDPLLMDYHTTETEFRTHVGFKSKRDMKIALELWSCLSGVGSSFSVFDGRYHYRLVFSVTPVDDQASDLFNTIWYPREPGDPNAQPSPAMAERISETILYTVDEDLIVWRGQAHVAKPMLASQDVRPFRDLQNFYKGFFEDAKVGVVSEHA